MQENNPNPPGEMATHQTPGCPPCEIPAFCRSYFYTGKLLTERDLNSDQRYLIDKLRLHHVALHGWGVVCGLMVRPHAQCSDRVVITPGFAIDDCGREIRVLKEHVVYLPKPKRVDEQTARWAAYEPEARGHGDRDEYERERKTFYVCLAYNECQEEFMTVPYDDCCGTTQKPNRVCESFTVSLLEEPPECLERAHHHRRCEEDDCQKIYETLTVECPPTGHVCCIPLAVIRSWHHCEPLREEIIDNSIRPIVPSARLLEQLIHCALNKLPKGGRQLTHIKYFNWEHDREYRHNEFLHKLVGTADAPQGFEVEFDRRVHPMGLNARTFQAMIVREPGEQHEHRWMEIAPGRVMRSSDGYRCTLHIDSEFARRHCQEHDFDVYISLKCDKVVDEYGLAVDGNLRGRLLREEDGDYMVGPPTGDGTQGGLFESWIRVRRAR